MSTTLFTWEFLDAFLIVIWTLLCSAISVAILMPWFKPTEALMIKITQYVAIAFALLSAWRLCKHNRIPFEIVYPCFYAASLAVTWVQFDRIDFADSVVYALAALVAAIFLKMIWTWLCRRKVRKPQNLD